MNCTHHAGPESQCPAYVKERPAPRLGSRYGCPVQTRQHRLVRRFPRKIRPPVPATGGRRYVQINPAKRPDKPVACSDPPMWPAWKTAHICSARRKMQPTNNWMEPAAMRHAAPLFDGAMRDHCHVRGAVFPWARWACIARYRRGD